MNGAYKQREILKKMKMEGKGTINHKNKNDIWNFWNTLRNGGLENLTLTGYTEMKRDRGK